MLIKSEKGMKIYLFSYFNIFFYKCISFHRIAGKFMLIVQLITPDFSDTRPHLR